MNLEDDHDFTDMGGFPMLISRQQGIHSNYYNDYCRLYLANFVLTSQVKELMKDKKDLEQKVYQLEEKMYDEDYSDLTIKNKRMRRTACEINRFHQCTVKGCGKSYGSQGSLNQHLKIKHPEVVQEEESEEEVLQVQPLKQNIIVNDQKLPKNKRK